MGSGRAAPGGWLSVSPGRDKMHLSAARSPGSDDPARARAATSPRIGKHPLCLGYADFLKAPGVEGQPERSRNVVA
jgi:hypothetical protein